MGSVNTECASVCLVITDDLLCVDEKDLGLNPNDYSYGKDVLYYQIVW